MKIEFGFWTWGRELREERGGVIENSCMEWVVAAAVKERRTRGGGKCCYGTWNKVANGKSSSETSGVER